MDWSDIALPSGSPEQGHLGMQLNFRLPDKGCEIPATERQAEAVRLFFEVDFGELCDCQAHTLLSCREYGRICGDVIYKQYPSNVSRILAKALTAYILKDEEITRFATQWSERNFKNGTGSPRVRGTPFFSDIELFASFLDGMLEMGGWTSQKLKRFVTR